MEIVNVANRAAVIAVIANNKDKMKKAIEEEEYEVAAKLRDKISKFEI